MVNNSLKPKVMCILAKIAPWGRTIMWRYANHNSQEESLQAQREGLKQRL